MPIQPDRELDKIVYDFKNDKESPRSVRWIAAKLKLSVGGVVKRYKRHEAYVSHNNETGVRSRKVDKSPKEVIDTVHGRV
jgi:hypothetical protein